MVIIGIWSGVLRPHNGCAVDLHFHLIFNQFDVRMIRLDLKMMVKEFFNRQGSRELGFGIRVRIRDRVPKGKVWKKMMTLNTSVHRSDCSRCCFRSSVCFPNMILLKTFFFFFFVCNISHVFLQWQPKEPLRALDRASLFLSKTITVILSSLALLWYQVQNRSKVMKGNICFASQRFDVT